MRFWPETNKFLVYAFINIFNITNSGFSFSRFFFFLIYEEGAIIKLITLILRFMLFVNGSFVPSHEMDTLFNARKTILKLQMQYFFLLGLFTRYSSLTFLWLWTQRLKSWLQLVNESFASAILPLKPFQQLEISP